MALVSGGTIALNVNVLETINNQMKTIKFNQLEQGQKFRFDYDAEDTIRVAQQIGKTEIYCPIIMPYSSGGKVEVYLKSERDVILIP